MNAWIWAIGSLVVAFFEFQCPGCYLIWIAIGGTITALFAFAADLSLGTQLVIFAVACSVSCVAGSFAYRLLLKKNPPATLNQRYMTMIGAKGLVTEAIANGQGKVRLGDSVWLAEGPDLQSGAPVAVVGVRGTVLIVEAIK